MHIVSDLWKRYSAVGYLLVAMFEVCSRSKCELCNQRIIAVYTCSVCKREICSYCCYYVVDVNLHVSKCLVCDPFIGARKHPRIKWLKDQQLWSDK